TCSSTPRGPARIVHLSDVDVVGSNVFGSHRNRESRQYQTQLLPTAHCGRRCELHCLIVDAPFRPAIEQLVEGDASFQPSEISAEAVVHALPESQIRD